MPVSFSEISIGSSWSRPQLAQLWGYTGFQALARGVVTPARDNKIILFVTEEKQASATTYVDLLREDVLDWEGPNDHFAEERILNAQARSDEIHLFHRQRHHSDFQYRGELRLLKHIPRSNAPSKFAFEVLDPERNKWTKEQLAAAFFLYLQMRPSDVRQDAEAVIHLAKGLHKSQHSVATKLRTLAQLDPLLSAHGSRATNNVTSADVAVWDAFTQDWSNATIGAAHAFEEVSGPYWDLASAAQISTDDTEYLFREGRTAERIVEVRRDQYIFRRAVLSSYNGICCMSGLDNERLLIASHIVPWSVDKKNRLNPSNGLCLSVLHDRAYDQGLITVLPDSTVKVREDLLDLTAEEIANVFRASDGKKIRLPGRFAPAPDFLRAHAMRFGFM